MVTLDAPALKLQLTPEVAIDIAQKEVRRRGWDKFDLSDIVTAYVPFYIFSFDVIAEGGAPPGKAALNANTGDINEFVPVLMERPISREKKTPEGMNVDVEPTNIKMSEVEKVATVKIANVLGAKRENIVISAVSKIYIPFFRMWIDAANDSFKIEVDGCLGYATGAEVIPEKQKTWEESTATTLEKMRSPSGLMQLLNATFSEIGKLIAGKGSTGGPTKQLQWIAILAVIVIVAFFIYQQFGTSVQCTVNEDFLSRPQFFGLIGERSLYPQELEDGVLFVEGTCKFSSRGNNFIIGTVYVNKGDFPVASTTVNATTEGREVEKTFQVSWPRDETPGKYSLTFEKIVG